MRCSMTTQQWKEIGRHFPPIEDTRFVLGKGRYVNDVVLPGMLPLATVPSPHVHARIVRIDTRKAAQAPGVAAVIVGDDLPTWMEPIRQNLYFPNVLWYPLAVGKARYAGEWVAAVVATSRSQAEDAAELVEVTYEPLEPVVDPLEALKPEAPVLHARHDYGRRDPPAGQSAADRIGDSHGHRWQSVSLHGL